MYSTAASVNILRMCGITILSSLPPTIGSIPQRAYGFAEVSCAQQDHFGAVLEVGDPVRALQIIIVVYFPS